MYNKPGDTRTLEPFLNEMKELYGDIPEYIVADAGYGSESNYKMILDDFEKTPLITYGMYIKEGKKIFKNDPFISANCRYNELDDYYLCPIKSYISSNIELDMIITPIVEISKNTDVKIVWIAHCEAIV